MDAPNFVEENKFWQREVRHVIGFDEAGRGCLAGPVSAAAYVWKNSIDESLVPDGIADSKKISEKQRERLFDPLRTSAHSFWGHGYASATEIDRWNILQATCLAMARALEALLRSQVASAGESDFDQCSINPRDYAFLIDGKLSLMSRVKFLVHERELAVEFPLSRHLLAGAFQEVCLVKGDQKSLSIAAASIIAKVTRDRHMQSLHAQFPRYDFVTHKGYSTAAHKKLLQMHGPCKEHRFSFAPVREVQV